MERDQFQIIRTRLTTLLEKQITEFRYCFPFGRPEGALEKTISLLERVSNIISSIFSKQNSNLKLFQSKSSIFL